MAPSPDGIGCVDCAFTVGQDEIRGLWFAFRNVVETMGMKAVEGRDQRGFFPEAGTVMEVARDSKERKVLHAAHRAEMFAHKRAAVRVTNVAQVLTNAFAECSTRLSNVAYAARRAFDHINHMR